MKKLSLVMALVLLLCFAMSACGNLSTGDVQSHPTEAESVSGGISDTVSEYGLLSGYDAESGKLTYIPIEIVEESDGERIKELEAQGVELEFPNGYFVYQSNEIELNFSVAESASISLLNDEFTLEQSSIDAVADRLEGHPPFFLCKLDLVEGTIVGIAEHFVP